MQFQKSLQEKLGEHDPTEVNELILDELFEFENFTPDHKKTLELYNNLTHLSLGSFGLKSLKNFPKLPNLEILELTQNKLTGSDFAELKTLFPKLYKLKVGENPIQTLDVFKAFLSFPTLKKLELLGADVTSKETYRDDLFKLLKEVEIIDKMNRGGDEIDSTIYDEEGEEIEDDFEDDEFEDEDEEDFEDDEDLEDDEDEEEDRPAPANNKKQRKD